MNFLAKLLIVVAVGCSACAADRAANKPGGPAPAPTSLSEKNGEYAAKGRITKINPTLGSVELDHEDIPNLMPAMRMEFYLADKAMLDSIVIGDEVDFTILYKDGTETITKITPR